MKNSLTAAILVGMLLFVMYVVGIGILDIARAIGNLH